MFFLIRPTFSAHSARLAQDERKEPETEPGYRHDAGGDGAVCAGAALKSPRPFSSSLLFPNPGSPAPTLRGAAELLPEREGAVGRF